jgi:hypothetical protein
MTNEIVTQYREAILEVQLAEADSSALRVFPNITPAQRRWIAALVKKAYHGGRIIELELQLRGK